MADLETVANTGQAPAPAEGPGEEEARAVASAIPHPRRFARLFEPTPSFNSGEHMRLGDGVVIFGIEGVYSASLHDHRLKLAPDLKLTYGQIVALAGDLYGVPDKPISSGDSDKDRRHRFDAAFNTLVNADRKELNKILEIMIEEQEAVDRRVRQGESPDEAYANLPDFDDRYMRATGYTNWPNMGRYFELAVKNFDHFGDDAVTTYRTGHARAIDEARAAYDMRRQGGGNDAANDRFELALAMNAFADHFLTDLFAAGHLRVPRRAVAKDFDLEGHASAIARHQHIEENHFGLFVRNRKGRCWKCFGDTHLETMQGYENRMMVANAVQISVNEVWEAYRTGHVTTHYAALDEIPKLDEVGRREAGKDGRTALNQSPAFVMDGGKTQGRYPFEESDRHEWSRLHYRNFWIDHRTSAAVLLNNVFTGKSIEGIKPPRNMIPAPTIRPRLLRWAPASRSASPLGNNVQVRWAIALVEPKTYPGGEGTASNVSALGPWSDWVFTQAGQAPVLEVPVDPSGRATERRLARQVQGQLPEMFGMGIGDNRSTEWTDTGA